MQVQETSQAERKRAMPFFRFRDYLALGVFAVCILQNFRTYRKDTESITLISDECQQEVTSTAVDRISNSTTSTTTTTTKAWGTLDDHDETTIRSWGCNLRQTPLIFVHIGKSGGGMVRARFAASALNFGQNQSWRHIEDAYYPIDESTKGYFCNSGHPNYKPHGKKSFEGTIFCHASTPIGQAVACPEPAAMRRHDGDHGCRKACRLGSDSCHTVYVGHNLLGNEMHWLPPAYLSNWFEDYLASNPTLEAFENDEDETSDNNIRAYLQTLEPDDPAWCPYKNKTRPVSGGDYKENYAACSVALQHAVDKEALLTVQRRHPSPSSALKANGNNFLHQPHDLVDWSHIYASMPVLRTTIVRDPFSWLVSKFFWHGGGGGADDSSDDVLKCDDIEAATQTVSPFYVHSKKARPDGWASRYAHGYLTYLCGEDCAARYQQGIGSLEQMERQAAGNLRHSFAVVGLLEETDTFYDMVTKRVAYVDMSLNPDVEGGKHSSGKGEEQLRCKEKFADPSFQAQLKERSPVIAAVDRLYHIAVQVNRFQLEELKACQVS